MRTLGMQRRRITGQLAEAPERLKNNITKHKETTVDIRNSILSYILNL